MGGVGNGAAEEDWHGDLNPGTAAIPGGEDHAALAEWDPMAATQPVVMRA